MVVISATIPVVVGTAAATSCANTDASDFARDDRGHWLVTRHHPTLYEYDTEWVRLGDRDPDIREVSAVAAASDGGWWVVNDSRQVINYPRDWSEPTAKYPLERPGEVRRPVSDIDVSGDVAWVLTDGKVRRYDLSFGSPTGSWSVDGEIGGIWVADGTIWGITHESDVFKYELSESDTLTRTNSRSNVSGRVLDHPTDIRRAGDGRWWLLSMGGGVAEYTDDWRHTGRSYGDLNHEFGCLSLAMFEPLLMYGAYVTPVLVGITAAIHISQTFKYMVSRCLAGFTSLLVADIFYNYRLGARLTPVYTQPEAVVSTIILAIAGCQTLVLTRTTRVKTVRDIAILVLINVPLLGAAYFY